VVATFIDITPRKQAEDELRESEARLRRALEIETVGVMFFTMDGRITDANNAFLKMSGYARDDLAKGVLRWDQMTPPVYMERSLHAIDEFKRTGKTSTYEKEYIRKDGSRWWGLFSATKLSDDLGVEYVLDISDRKAAEDALRASEERFRQFAENSADVFWIIDAETQRLEYLNPVYEQMWGEPRETLMRNSSHWLELVHPDDRARAEQAMPRALAGETFILEYRIVRRADGDIRWIRDTIFPIRNSLGRITRVAGVAQDVTNDRGASEALRVTEERFRLLVEGTPDYAMFLLDPANKIIFWSSGAERVFGWTAEEAVGQTGALIFTSEDRAEGVVEEEINIARDKSYAPDRRWHLRKDGSRFWVDGVLRRLDAQDGSLRGFAKIARDATEQRRFEDALHDERSSLEQRVLERTAELMASNTELQNEIRTRQQLERDLLMITERERRRMSEDLHDVVCQELTATALFLKSSGNKAGDEETARILNEAAEIVNHNVVVARDLARAFQPAIVGSGGLTAALRALCAQANAAEHVSCRLKLPRAIRLKDETLALNLYRIAQEAVANAVKHSDASDILVCMERENSTLRLVVEDNGKGFRPRKRGKGLGLHIMKHRASVLGGQIRITTPRKGGTKIVTEVPLKKTET
jgi:PAS domain S-box-containing protein